MEYSAFSRLFCNIFAQNGLQRFCDELTVRKFYDFTNIFLDANAKFNLSAIRDIPGMVAKHYADCLLAEPYFPQHAHVLDVGCGGGFPCIPLAIARPDLQITAVDSTQKKIHFVDSAASELSLNNLKAICGRIEGKEMGRMRGSFDVVVSRAVARLNILVELCVPYVRIGGAMLALKGAQGREELAEAENALRILGVRDEKDICANLAFEGNVEQRHMILLYKTRSTPLHYPRQYAAIQKKPL